MNKQKVTVIAGNAFRAGIEWPHIFGPGSGFTVNPVRGCEHGCKWRMPDGTIVDCYAESQRERLDGPGAFKQISFHPNVFEGIRARKEPAGIFIDSMSELMGAAVPSDWIMAVLAVMKQCPQHIFFVLTKNAVRLPNFSWPDNALVGISAPPTFMYGKEMNVAQQRTWFKKSAQWLVMDTKAKHKWISLEPLTVDVSDILADYPVDWAVIGAGSDGPLKYQPDEMIFTKTLWALLDYKKTAVFFKGNLCREMADRHGGWRQEFPKL